ncbi:MAG: TolC family protein [Sediminibacterium sp.]|nr:TolC family protein [Sediminibacterium sp.]
MNKTIAYFKSIFFLILFVGMEIQTISAQEHLTIEEAIKSALEKNYALLIAKGNVSRAQTLNNLGEAGLLPSLNLTAGYNGASVNSYQEFATGGTQLRNGAQSNAANAALNASWVIFDGLNRFTAKKQLDNTEKRFAMAFKEQMETTVYEVIAAYYNIVKIEELQKSARQNLTVYDEKQKISRVKSDIGLDSKVDLLLIQADYNKVKSTLLQLELEKWNAKVRLNTLMGRQPDVDYNVVDSIPLTYSPVYEELKKSAITSNATLQLARLNEQQAQLNVKTLRGQLFPIVQINASYSFLRSQNQAGLLVLNRQDGINGGIQANWPLFSGLARQKRIKDAQLNALNNQYQIQETTLMIDAGVFSQYKTYELNRQITQLEEQNLRDANTLQTISMERYRNGKAAVLETMETQRLLEETQVRRIQARYNCKLAEAALLRLNGQLVK